MDCFVKESYGVIWHFYHNSHGICYCKMTDENISKYQVLLPEGQEDFDVIVDDSNCIHMVFQNKEGDIVYANHFNEQWRKTTLLQSKSRAYYPKQFILKRVNNWLNLMYLIEYDGRKMLTHQIIDSEESSPYVIDCIRDNFCVAQDSSGNIVSLFFSESNKAWGIKTYVWSQKKWGNFEEIHQLKDCKNPFLFIDVEDKMHIVYERDFCIFEYFDKKEKMTGTGQRPIMVYQNDNIIMWEGITDNKIFIRNSTDNAPTVFMSGGFSKPSIYKLRYTTYETDLIADYCTGNILNGSVKLYGINGFFVVSHTTPVSVKAKPEDEIDGSYIEIQKLKIKISQMSNIIDKLQRKLEEYDSKKIDRRIKELETAVNKSDKPKLFSFF